MAHLYFLMKQPEQEDRILIWDTRTLSIGRAPENDLTLEDDEVSRKHALLTNENGVLEVGDYRTGNGTFVNGDRVSQKKRFQVGDTLGIGKLQMELREGDEHPAKLGLRADYASHLKTLGMMPEAPDGDANATVLGLGDTAESFADQFVIEPERGSGEVAFVVGEDGGNEFQMRELDDSLNDMDFDMGDDALSLDGPVDPPPATRPLTIDLEPADAAPAAAGTPAPGDTQSGADPMERMRKLKVLRDEGLITEDEFQAKRAQILSEM